MHGTAGTLAAHLVVIQEGLDFAAEGAHIILVQDDFCRDAFQVHRS